MIPQCKSLLVIPASIEGMSISILYTNGFIKRIKDHYPAGIFQYPAFKTNIQADKVPAFKPDNALFKRDNWINSIETYGIEVTEKGLFLFRRDWQSILIPYGILPDFFVK